jgi:hypothetical protein
LRFEDFRAVFFAADLDFDFFLLALFAMLPS